MSSIFPKEMLSQGELSLDAIKARLHYFELQLHELHWQTASLAEHLALGDAYDKIFSVKDEIIEKIMGYTGVRTKAASQDAVKNYSPGLSMQVVSEVMDFARQLQAFASVKGMPDIENMAQDLSGFFAKIKYRLTLS